MGVGGGVLFGQEVETTGKFLVPEESASSTEAEDKSYRGKVDLLTLSQLCVQFVNHGLHCWVVNEVHDVEVCVVKIVLEESQSILPRGNVYASRRRALGIRKFAAACDTECEQVTVINNLRKRSLVNNCSAARYPLAWSSRPCRGNQRSLATYRGGKVVVQLRRAFPSSTRI